MTIAPRTIAPRGLLLATLLLGMNQAGARPLFVDGFDPYQIDPLFPMSGAQVVLPAGATGDRLRWLIGELAAGETTTDQEILDNFDPAWLAQIPVAQTRQFIETLRVQFPDGVVTDLVSLSPIGAVAVIDTPGSPPPHGWLSMTIRYTAGQRITGLGVSNWGGSVMYPDDANLTLGQAADKFMTLSSNGAILVGRIDAAHQCVGVEQRAASQPRAIASVFKSWLLAGTGHSIVQGGLASADTIPLVASELAPGGLINHEPLGTPFPVADLAVLMIANSENTSTDLLHEVIGRTAPVPIIHATASDGADLLLPFLNISEQFHLFHSFTLPVSLSYVNGSEAFQQQFLDNQIVPLGPNNGGPHFHTQLLTQGSWQASANDICRLFAWARRLPQGSEAMQLVDTAFGSGIAQPDVRRHWDRVWYKGGSLAAAGNSLHVLSHAWMLENAGEQPWVVIALANSDAGGIDAFQVQSVTGRILQRLTQP